MNGVTYIGIILIQEMNQPDIIIESDSVRFGKSVDIRHVGRRSVKSTKKVLAETDRFELYGCQKDSNA